MVIALLELSIPEALKPFLARLNKC